MQHILQILLKQLICFSGYSSLNYKIHFSSEHAVVHWMFTNNKLNFAILFVNSSNISVMSVSCLQLTQYLNSVQIVHQLQQYTVELNEIIWLLYQWIYAANHSMLSTKQSFSLEMLVSFGIYLWYCSSIAPHTWCICTYFYITITV